MRVLSERTRKTQLAVHWSRIHQVCPVARLHSIGVHLVGSHLRLHSHSAGQRQCRSMSAADVFSNLTVARRLATAISQYVDRIREIDEFHQTHDQSSPKDACLGEDEPQHYAFIFVAKGLQSCRLISFLTHVGTAGEIVECCWVREPSGTRLVVSPCTKRCPIRADGSQPRQPRSPFMVTISLRDFGSRIRCRSYFLECARKASKVCCCIVIESACLDAVRYPIPPFSRLQCSVGV